jgi:hypothetical protein
MSRQDKNMRRGVSLTELLVLMSSCVLILQMSAMLLHRAMRIELDSRSFIEAERSCSRLEHQFREDIHEAISVNIKNAKPTAGEFLVLQLPEAQTVTYSRSNGNIGRVMSRQGKVLARDDFAFQSSSSVEVREQELPKRVILSITGPALDDTGGKVKQLQSLKAVPVGLLVDACIARNEHLTSLRTERESAK